MYPTTNMYHNWIYLYPRIYMGGSGGGGCDFNHHVRFLFTRFTEGQDKINSETSSQDSVLSIVYVWNSVFLLQLKVIVYLFHCQVDIITNIPCDVVSFHVRRNWNWFKSTFLYLGIFCKEWCFNYKILQPWMMVFMEKLGTDRHCI